jgi:predicted amidophosphoribosyltransferase
MAIQLRRAGRRRCAIEVAAMERSIRFCNACGARVDEKERTCACCGLEATEANVIKLLRRTPPRKGRRDSIDTSEEDPLELLI